MNPLGAHCPYCGRLIVRTVPHYHLHTENFKLKLRFLRGLRRTTAILLHRSVNNARQLETHERLQIVQRYRRRFEKIDAVYSKLLTRKPNLP